jgi:hypothetical protein
MDQQTLVEKDIKIPNENGYLLTPNKQSYFK